MKPRLCLALLFLLLAVVPTQAPAPAWVGQPFLPLVPRQVSWRGVASWYGPGFYGRPTASGTVYTGCQLTAAHRSLPLGSIVQVTNLANGRTAVFLVNDRGPYSLWRGVRYYRGQREIDLSEAGAEVLGFKRSGLARVEISRLSLD